MTYICTYNTYVAVTITTRSTYIVHVAMELCGNALSVHVAVSGKVIFACK